jgi:hypothetical protein
MNEQQMNLFLSKGVSVRIAVGKLIFSLLFVLLCLRCAAQQAAEPAKSPIKQVAEAREKLRLAELEHPGAGRSGVQ